MDRPEKLNLGFLTRVFALLSVLLVIALAVAPVRGVFSEWRAAQDEYNEAAARIGATPVATGIRQIWIPELGVVDRCASCHLGMGGEEPVPEHRPYTAHPAIPHDPEKMGCTFCHGGQGRATTMEAAHGHAKHWLEPMLPLAHVEAGCGTCHTAAPVGSASGVERGKLLLARYDCLACHRLDGTGGGRAAPEVYPDLSGIGMRGIPDGWHEDHLARAAEAPEGLAGEAYGPIPADDRRDIEEYLGTLSGMPRLIEGKRLFFERGCRGCHAVNGVGGTEGADLTKIGERHLESFVFPKGFDGAETAFSWHVEHLLAPAEIVEASRMPDQGLSRPEAEKITLYLLSLRGRELPAEFTPPDRVRADRLGQRDFGTDGHTLNLVFCAACHGADGAGRPFGEMGESYPAITNADFLAVAPDEMIAKTIETGRPGRRMAAWAGGEGGLRLAEIRRLVGWLRSAEPTPPSFAEVAAASPDAARGAEVYRRECEVCHGADGGGGIGPSHDSPAFGSLATDEVVYRAIVDGRPGTAMARFRDLDAKTLASLTAHVRSFSGATLRPAPELVPGDPDGGREVYASSCARCHGAGGEGGAGPAIGKRGLFSGVGSGFVVESYARGRCREEDGGAPPEVARDALIDAAAWLEREAGKPASTLRNRLALGDPGRGATLYGRSCAGCHGKEGEGKEAPALANPAFLEVAGDGYLRATIARGRRGTAMPGFRLDQTKYPRLSGTEIDDIVSFVRGFAETGE